MQSAFADTNQVLETRIRRLHHQARAWLVLAIALALCTPVFAQWVVTTLWPQVQSNWLVTMTISSWPFLFVFYLVSYGFRLLPVEDGKSTPAPRFMFVALQGLSKRAGIPVPRLKFRRGTEYGAGVARGSWKRGVMVWRGDERIFTMQEVEAVLAHEVAHLVMGDVAWLVTKEGVQKSIAWVGLIMTLAGVLAVFIWFAQWLPGSIVNLAVAWLVITALLKRSSGSFVLAALAVIVWYSLEMPRVVPLALATGIFITVIGLVLSRMASMAYSRCTEYRADAIAIQLTSWAHRVHLMKALQKFRRQHLQAVPEGRVVRDRHWLWRTHPSIEERAKSLRLKIVPKSL